MQRLQTQKIILSHPHQLLTSTTWHQGYKSTNKVEQQQLKGHQQQQGRIMIRTTAAAEVKRKNKKA